MKHTLHRMFCLLLCAVLFAGMLPAVTASAATQLGAPSDVSWSPAMAGGIYWTVNKPVEMPEACYRVCLYKNGVMVHYKLVRGYTGDIDDYDVRLFDCRLDDEYDLTTGEYYVTVRALAQQDGYTNSKAGKSGTWSYTHPGTSYSCPTDLTWNYPVISWKSNAGYAMNHVKVYFSTTRDGIPEECAWSITVDADELDISDYISHYGKGYYFFKVRTESMDITQKYHSPWSLMSAAYCHDDRPQLGAPSDITWSPTVPGGVFWTVNAPVEKPTAAFRVDLYKNGSRSNYETVYTSTSNFENASHVYGDIDLTRNYDLTTGDYQIAVTALSSTEDYADSSTVMSDVWSYTHPGTRYSRPSNLTWNYPLVSWDSNYSSASYFVRVYRSDTPYGMPEEVFYGAYSDETTLDLSDYIRRGGKGYYCFQLRTHSWDINQKYHSAWTDMSERYYSNGRYLATPTAKVTTNSATGCPKVTWNKVANAEKYRLYRSTSEDGTYEFLKTTKTSSSFLDTTAEPGVTYYYKVRAMGEDPFTGDTCYSAWSNIVSDLCVLAKPAIAVSLDDEGQPKITWETVEGAAKYYIYRSTSKSSGFKHIKSAISARSYTDTTANAGTKYYYKVKAIHSDTAANSAYSAVKSVTAK